VAVRTRRRRTPRRDAVAPAVREPEVDECVRALARVVGDACGAREARDLGRDRARGEPALLLPALLFRPRATPGDVVRGRLHVGVVVLDVSEVDVVALAQLRGHDERERDVVELFPAPARAAVEVGVLREEPVVALLDGEQVLGGGDGGVDLTHRRKCGERLVEVARPDEVVADVSRGVRDDAFAPRDRRGSDAGTGERLVLDGTQRHRRGPVLGGNAVVFGDDVRYRDLVEERPPGADVRLAYRVVPSVERTPCFRRGVGRIAAFDEPERDGRLGRARAESSGEQEVPVRGRTGAAGLVGVEGTALLDERLR